MFKWNIIVIFKDSKQIKKMGNKSKSSTITVPDILLLIFVTLKLAQVGIVANWDWWWVLSPIWIMSLIVLIIVIIVILIK